MKQCLLMTWPLTQELKAAIVTNTRPTQDGSHQHSIMGGGEENEATSISAELPTVVSEGRGAILHWCSLLVQITNYAKSSNPMY